MSVQVCVVTIAYNNPEDLKKLLSSLRNQNDALNGLIIIDNSNDSFSEENKKIFNANAPQYHFARYHKTENNIGSAGGFRIGMRLAHESGFDWVWLLDQDGMPSPGCLPEMLKHAGESDIICPNIQSLDEPRVSIPKVYANNIFGAWYPASWCLPTCKIHAFGTHAALISKKALDTIGYYDDSFFFVGWEDYDYGYRATKAGLSIVFVRRAEAFHPGSRSRDTPKHLNLFPAHLDCIRDPAGKILCKRSRFLSPFSQAYLESTHLKPWQLAIALVYSSYLALYHRIVSERDIALMMTLRLYVKCLHNSIKKDWPYSSVEELCSDILR